MESKQSWPDSKERAHSVHELVIARRAVKEAGSDKAREAAARNAVDIAKIVTAHYAALVEN